MRILALGGTRFVGRHLVEAARAGGHEVAVFSRGRSPLPWDDIEHLPGDRESGDLRSLADRDWDVCLDVSAYVPEHVRDAASLLAPRVERYALISTASVYPLGSPAPIDESSPLQPLPGDLADEAGPNLYGSRKVACEQEAERWFPERVLIVRPGIVCGPYDPTNRFDWWAGRLGRGGEVLGPGSPGAAVQVIDGRDLARFTVSQMAAGTTGIFNACGAAATFGELIEACRTGAGSAGSTTWVSEQLLLEHGVEPFTELPLWLPDEPGNRAFYSISNARARAAGLELRPLAETARDTWAWLRAVQAGELPPAVAGGFVARGLAPEREAELLAAARAG